MLRRKFSIKWYTKQTRLLISYTGIYICLDKAHIAFACRSFFSVLYAMYLLNYTIYYFIDHPLDFSVEGYFHLKAMPDNVS